MLEHCFRSASGSEHYFNAAVFGKQKGADGTVGNAQVVTEEGIIKIHGDNVCIDFHENTIAYLCKRKKTGTAGAFRGKFPEQAVGLQAINQ
jgi:hypothetical protein